jgi:hypothetical protein
MRFASRYVWRRKLAFGACLATVLFGGLVGALAGTPESGQQPAPPLDNAGAERLHDFLARVPEAKLMAYDSPAQPDAAKGAKERLREHAIRSQKQHAENPDAFALELRRTRPDLGGLPFLMARDCTLTAKQAKLLETMADRIRFGLLAAKPSETPGEAPRRAVKKPGNKFDPDLFWGLMSDWETNALPGEESIRALQQLLIIEDQPVRLSFVQYLRLRKGRTATAALAQCVLFDLDPKVRAEAVAALKGRPVEDYAPLLLDGLRYPWAAVADRAGRALAALNVKQAVPRLVRLLDEPDPAAPVLKDSGGKTVPVVRELVRVNHFGNCLMCHPASTDNKDPVRGLVPVPGEPLTSPNQYGSVPDGIFVRADVTYLRPDFSVMHQVEKPGTWPARQRFDYLVRERALTDGERQAWQARQKLAARQPSSEHRRAVLLALRELTGGEARGSSAAPALSFWKGFALR